jgi:hypothetical protein
VVVSYGGLGGHGKLGRGVVGYGTLWHGKADLACRISGRVESR